MKVGIVVPFSWSYIGGVSEHAEAQAEALERLGFETRLIMGDDPPGTVWRLFHPDAGRLDRRPSRVMAIGTSVTVPANHSRTHIVLSQLAVLRAKGPRLLVVLSVSPTLARQFTIVTNASVVLSVAVYLASGVALLRLSDLRKNRRPLLRQAVTRHAEIIRPTLPPRWIVNQRLTELLGIRVVEHPRLDAVFGRRLVIR